MTPGRPQRTSGTKLLRRRLERLSWHRGAVELLLGNCAGSTNFGVSVPTVNWYRLMQSSSSGYRYDHRRIFVRVFYRQQVLQSLKCRVRRNRRTLECGLLGSGDFRGWYDDDVTQGAVWRENSTATTISSRGVLTTLDVTSDRTVTVTGSYSSGGATLSDTAVVTVRNVDGPLPTKPLNPAPGATLSPGPVLNSAVVALTWGPSSGVVNYDFMVADVTAGTPGVIELQDQAFGTSYVASLTAGKRYRWQVRACNAAGCTSYTSWRYFRNARGWRRGR